MTAAAPIPSQSFAERIAWMHEPVHLRCALLPWFVRRMLEDALFGFFCSLEQALLTLMELHRQGKLEPWPEPSDAEPAPRLLNDRPISARPASRRRARGAQTRVSTASAPAMVEEWGAARCVGAWLLDGNVCGPYPYRAQLGGLAPFYARCRSDFCFEAAWMRRETCVQIVPFS